MMKDDESFFEFQSSTKKQKKKTFLQIPQCKRTTTVPSRLGSGNRDMACKVKPPAAVPKI
jgi:hypothetical protein